MRKLLKLRQWLTLSEGAQSLSMLVREEVTAADLLRLAIDRQLTLSVHFVNGMTLRQWVAVDMESVTWTEVPSPDGKEVVRYPDGGTIGFLEDGSTVQLMGPVFHFQPGLVDLPMIGSEATEVEREYQRMTGGPPHTVQSWAGITVRTSGGHLFDVHARKGDSEDCETNGRNPTFSEPQEFLPASSLPEDAVFVVRTESLTTLQAKLAAAEDKSHGASEPMAPRAETTYLCIIGALLELVRTPRPDRDSEAAVIRELIGSFNHLPGIAKSTLERKFADAKRQMNAILPP